MSEMLNLKPEDAKILHPEAVKWFNLLRKQIESDVSLEEISHDDIIMFLTADELLEFDTSVGEISKELSKCINKDGTPPNNNTLGEIALDLAAMKAGINLLVPMNNLRFLLKKVKECKVLKAKEEQRKLEEDEKCKAEKAREEQRTREEKVEAERREKEDSERWRAAYVAVNPPMDDAKKYIKEEYDKFEKASWKAIDIYIEKGEGYLHDSRTFEYRWYLDKINKEKEKEQILNDAKAQATIFDVTLDQGLKEIEKMLSTKKESPEVFFRSWCSDNGEKRYLGEPFTDILASDNFRNRNWTQGYIDPAEDSLRQSIPKELRDFILMKPTVAFFLLPEAHFGHYGVPCLDIYFNVFAVVTITVLAQAGKKVFNGYAFNFLTNLREPKCLGFYQITIRPRESRFWQAVPLSILYALMDGNLTPSGTTLLQRTPDMTIYQVKKFEDDICEIPISLERCCRSLGTMEKLKELKIINGRTAEVLELPGPVDHKGTKKQPLKQSKKGQMFSLFDEGNLPSSPRVKALGLKYKSCRNYYALWKKNVNHSGL